MQILSKSGRKYIIRTTPSIFTSRKGKNDVCILQQSTGFDSSPWGGREIDGKLYNTILRLDSETGGVLSNYSVLPVEITFPLLKQWGFL